MYQFDFNRSKQRKQRPNSPSVFSVSSCSNLKKLKMTHYRRTYRSRNGCSCEPRPGPIGSATQVEPGSRRTNQTRSRRNSISRIGILSIFRTSIRPTRANLTRAKSEKSFCPPGGRDSPGVSDLKAEEKF